MALELYLVSIKYNGDRSGSKNKIIKNTTYVTPFNILYFFINIYSSLVKYCCELRILPIGRGIYMTIRTYFLTVFYASFVII